MTYAEALNVIEQSGLNNAQARSARNLLKVAEGNTKTTLTEDEVQYELSIKMFGDLASFALHGDSRLYATTLICTLGPRGGKDNVTKRREYQHGGKAGAFYL